MASAARPIPEIGLIPSVRSGVLVFSCGKDVPKQSRFGPYDFWDISRKLEHTAGHLFQWLLAETSPEWRPLYVRCDLSFLSQLLRVSKRQLRNIRDQLLETGLISHQKGRNWNLTAHPERLAALPLRPFQAKPDRKPQGVAVRSKPEIHFRSEIVKIGVETAKEVEIPFRSPEAYCHWQHDCSHKFSELAQTKSLDKKEEASSSEATTNLTHEETIPERDQDHAGEQGGDTAAGCSVETMPGWNASGQREMDSGGMEQPDPGNGDGRALLCAAAGKTGGWATSQSSADAFAQMAPAERFSVRLSQLFFQNGKDVPTDAQCAQCAAMVHKSGAEPQELLEWAIKYNKIANARGPGILSSWVDGFKRARALRASPSAKKPAGLSNPTHRTCRCGKPIVSAQFDVCFDCERDDRPPGDQRDS